MGLLRAIRRLVLQNRPKKQNQDSRILQLPSEVILEIVGKLPQGPQIVVSQTCRAMRHLIHKYYLRDEARLATLLPVKERLDCLFSIARNMPDRWVCHRCVKLHRIDSRDTPARPQCATCPLGFRWLQKDSYGRRPFNNNLRHHPPTLHNINYAQNFFNVNHRHLQLTLKYSRLASKKRRHQKYLGHLLAPHHTRFSPSLFGDSVIKGFYSVYPKVVNGRYLLFSTWDYQKDAEEVSYDTMGFLILCQHQHIFTPQCLLQESTRIIQLRTRIDRMRSKRTQQCSRPLEVLNMALDNAFASSDTEICDSCSFCRTDFSVKASSERVTISAWQDLGPEGTPSEPSWRVQVDRWGGVVRHKPGSIRELYSHCDN